MDVCPHCGENLPPRATTCKACGSDAKTGWSDDIEYRSVELPELSDAHASPSSGHPIRNSIVILLALTLLGPLFVWLWHRPTGPLVVIFIAALIVLRLLQLGVARLRRKSRKAGDRSCPRG